MNLIQEIKYYFTEVTPRYESCLSAKVTFDRHIIQDFIIDGFDIENSNFPCAVCIKCHVMLLKKHKDPDFLMPVRNIDYEPSRPTALRSIKRCTCRICYVARTGGLQYRKSMMKSWD